jgi:DNA-binding MurR/RpiR family transcriptional regulator
VPSDNPIFEDITREDDAGTVAAKVFTASQRALDETLQMLDRAAFGRAVERLLQAGAIWFYGVGTSATLATDASYRFMRIGLPAHAAVDPHIMRLSAGLLGSGDLAVGISYTGRTIDTVRALTIARESGATTLCITSHLGSPITRVSDLVLTAATSETKVMREATYSRIAHIAILDSLYVCAALGRHDTTVRQLGKMAEHLEETRY